MSSNSKKKPYNTPISLNTDEDKEDSSTDYKSNSNLDSLKVSNEVKKKATNSYDDKVVLSYSDLSLFFNNITPKLQLGVITDGSSGLQEKVKTISFAAIRRGIVTKQASVKLGNSSLANLFKQCCAIIILVKDDTKYKLLQYKILATSRYIINVHKIKNSINNPYIINSSIEDLALNVVSCKGALNDPYTCYCIRDTVTTDLKLIV